jgi:hypothetical protein
MRYSESDLLFDFNENFWTALTKFDETKAFQNAQEAIPGTKGIDFVGIKENQSLVLFEIKNFRGYRIQNKPRIEAGEDPLWLKVAQKMRDSIAVTVGAARQSTNNLEDWKTYMEFLKNENKIIHFVLWLEEDLPPQSFKAKKKWEKQETFLRRRLKESLRWLSARVDVASISNNPFENSLTVNYL